MMNQIFKKIYTTTILSLFFLAFVQAQTDSTRTLTVAGNCAMCKKRIETAAKMHGVETAIWNAGDNLLQIKYNPQKVQLEAIKKNIAQVGHDVDNLVATDESYAKLHECCMYPRLENGKVPEKKAVTTDNHDHPHTVTGVVVEENEKGDLKPIIGANLHWANLPTKNTRTNENGVFKLDHKEGFNKLVVSYVGMKSDTITIKDLHELIMITAKGNVLMEVEVKGT